MTENRRYPQNHPGMAARRRHACAPASPGRRETPLSDVGLDRVEVACLTLTRRMLLSMCLHGSAEWDETVEPAVRGFGATRGPKIALATAALLGKVRRSRSSTFVFGNPSCPNCARILTEEERRLITALASVRRGRVGAAHVQLMLLCEDKPAGPVLQALNTLSALLPPAAPDERTH